MLDVIIVVEGGCIQSVYASDIEQIQVTLVDYDNLGFQENSEITRGNYPVEKMDQDWSKAVWELVQDIKTVDNKTIKVWQAILQCCACENYFDEPTEDYLCPICKSDNWVHGYIDEKGYYEDAH